MKVNIFYGEDECQSLHCETMDDAIEEILDGSEEDPVAVEICKYRTLEVSKKFLEGRILEYCLEFLDEEFGNYESDDVTEITQKMKEAEQAFINALLEEYQPWQCEVIEKKIINVAEWRKNNTQT